MTDEEYERLSYGCTERGFDFGCLMLWLGICAGVWLLAIWLFCS